MLDYIGEYNGWQIFRNSEGFLEGYKGVGKKIKIDAEKTINSDSKRLVTNTKTPTDFIKFVNGSKPKKSSLPPPEQPKLFPDEL